MCPINVPEEERGVGVVDFPVCAGQEKPKRVFANESLNESRIFDLEFWWSVHGTLVFPVEW
jgi:hypothetical protein